MHSNDSSSLFGAATGVLFFSFSLVPEVPPIAQWICLILSAIASILAISKNFYK